LLWRRVRLAYVTETWPPEVNGVAGTAARTVEWLRSRGHAVTLLRPRQPGEATRDDSSEWLCTGVALPVYRDLRAGLARPAAVGQRLTAARAELVHIATEGPLGWAALRAGRRLGLPVSSDLRTHFDLYSAHYGLGWLQGAIGNYLRGFHNATDCTFVPTAPLAQALGARGFRGLEVVARGVDTQRYSPERRSEALRAAWGAGPLDSVVLHVGRLAPEKNMALLLRALHAAHAARPGVRCVVVGDGPARPRVEAEAPPGTVFTGTLRGEALAAHYASADVFVFPSVTETFGNVTLEALASGLLLVAFDAAAAGQHVSHGVNGLLARPGDEALFVELVRRAVHPPGGARALRLLARRSALAASWDAVLTRFEARLYALREAGAAPLPAYAA
jgi:glycosyltransferase involved in cell wall biosynthesis